MLVEQAGSLQIRGFGVLDNMLPPQTRQNGLAMVANSRGQDDQISLHWLHGGMLASRWRLALWRVLAGGGDGWWFVGARELEGCNPSPSSFSCL